MSILLFDLGHAVVLVTVIQRGQVVRLAIFILVACFDGVDVFGPELRVACAEVEGVLVFRIWIQVIALGPVYTVAVVELQLVVFREIVAGVQGGIDAKVVAFVDYTRCHLVRIDDGLFEAQTRGDTKIPDGTPVGCIEGVNGRFVDKPIGSGDVGDQIPRR